MRIVLDAMGGDHAPQATVEGGVWAARKYGLEVVLVGKRDTLNSELANYDTSSLSLQIVHASQVLEMEAEPAYTARTKKDSSMAVGMDLVRAGKAEAFYSAGNSGGVMAAALFRLGRISGIRRPAFSLIFPTSKGHCVLLDVGANTDCKAEWLLQFGIMGSIYAEKLLGVQEPSVGIVSNGEEEGKGSALVKEAYQLLKASHLNFIGNVEGKDIPKGRADVVVTDGLTGNVIVKLSEGLSKFVTGVIEKEIKSSPLTTLGGLLARPAFARARRVLDYTEIGGVPLLGIDGVVIVGHGRSNAKAIMNGIGVAKRAVEGGMLQAISESLQDTGL